MKFKKLLAVGFAFAMILGVVACTNNEEVKEDMPQGEAVMGRDLYGEYYTQNYNDYLMGLNSYNMYMNSDMAIEQYQDKEYPGNEKYLEEVKSAYNDSKEKIQKFVTELKSEKNLEDEELKQMNQDMIDKGEKVLEEIDAKLANLDKLTDEDLKKDRDDFIRATNEVTKLETDISTEFNNLIKDMNEMFKVNPNK